MDAEAATTNAGSGTLRTLRQAVWWVSLPFFVLGLLLPIYGETIGASVVEIGLFFAVFSLMTVLLRPFVGWGLDRFGRRPFYLLGVGRLRGAWVAFAFIDRDVGHRRGPDESGGRLLVPLAGGQRDRGRCGGRGAAGARLRRDRAGQQPGLDRRRVRGDDADQHGAADGRPGRDRRQWRAIFPDLRRCRRHWRAGRWRGASCRRPTRRMRMARAVTAASDPLDAAVGAAAAGDRWSPRRRGAWSRPSSSSSCKTRSGWPTDQLAWAFLPSGVGVGAAAGAAGDVGRPFGRKRLMVIGLIGAAAVSLLIPSLANWIMLALLWGGAGALLGGGRPGGAGAGGRADRRRPARAGLWRSTR